MRELRVIVAGGRGLRDWFGVRPMFDEALDHVFSNAVERGDNITVISGTAHGADRMGEQYAMTHHFKLERYPADWDRHGRAAGYKRNVKMAKVATHLVAFWDGKSRGTRHMIRIALELGLTVRVFLYDDDREGFIAYIPQHGDV